MKDKTPKEIKQFRDYIRTVADDLRCKFYLQEYELGWDWREEEDGEGYDHIEGRGAAKINSDTVYLRLTLTICSPIYEMYLHNQLKEIYAILVHEFCHVLVAPLFKELHLESHPQAMTFIGDIHERQTQRIANVILYSDFDIVPWKKKIVSAKRKK
jgi:hypothetical protein